MRSFSSDRRSGRRRRPQAVQGLGAAARLGRCPERDLWSTSSACAARWTSCSATSGATELVVRSAAAGLLPAGGRLLLRRAAEGGGEGRSRRGQPRHVSLEISGRELVISGERPVQETEGRVYQQVEIETGPFRRVIELNADVDAEGARRPTRTASSASCCRFAPAAGRLRQRPDRDPGVGRMAQDGQRRPDIEVVETPDVEEAIRERQGRPLPAALPVLPLKEMVTYPDTLTPLAVGQPRSIRLVNDVLSGERTLVMVASREPEVDRARAGPAVRRRGRGDRRPHAEGPRRDDSHPRPGDPAGESWATTSRRSPTSWRGSSRCPTSSSPPPSSRR